MKLLIILLGLFIIANPVLGQPGMDEEKLLKTISKEPPRLFLNSGLIDKVKANALSRDRMLFEEIRERIEKLNKNNLELVDPLIRDGHQSPNHHFGTRAAEAALLFLILDDHKYLELSILLLKKTIEYYQLRNENNLNIHWFNYSRVNALAAYDWIYKSLSESERIELGQPLLECITFMTDHNKRRNVFRRNGGGTKTGFYGPNALCWYAGVVFHKLGIDDPLAERLLIQGYQDHIQMLDYRSQMSGDDGGANSGTIGYALGAYPLTSFNFFHTFYSATGVHMANRWDFMPNFLNYVFWNWLPGNLEFGYGDARHFDNLLPVRSLRVHLDQLIHFYQKDNPGMVNIAQGMIDKLEEANNNDFPYLNFFIDTLENNYSSIAESSPNLPLARHFEKMGQVFFRSGNHSDDTYALFTSGGITQHKHYDNNNFLIYKNGFLALDSGTRPQPGIHLSHYYCRTIAHNCITIRMPGEEFPEYWGGPSLNEENWPIPNDGGQNDLDGGRIIAFDEKQEYAYVAGDATLSYHEDKAEEVIRQFIFLPPDHFVVFDRVKSSKADYPKRWLLHTASEPNMMSMQFDAYHRGGTLFAKTLFPEEVSMTKIGGDGKQFWSDGKNWSLPELTPQDWNYEGMKWLNNDHDLFGQWRVEVAPTMPSKLDFFLHLIQAGDKNLKSMVDSQLIESDTDLGIKFEFRGKAYSIQFSKKGEVGGTILIRENGIELINESLSTKVKPQAGF